jgi:hypothetical protein
MCIDCRTNGFRDRLAGNATSGPLRAVQVFIRPELIVRVLLLIISFPRWTRPGRR